MEIKRARPELKPWQPFGKSIPTIVSKGVSAAVPRMMYPM
jgi:hypothetical protein